MEYAGCASRATGGVCVDPCYTTARRYFAADANTGKRGMDSMGPGMHSSTFVTLAHSLSIFDPASPSTHSIFNLALLTLAVAGLIFLIVEGVLLYSVWQFRQPPNERTSGEPPQVYGSMPIEVA